MQRVTNLVNMTAQALDTQLTEAAVIGAMTYGGAPSTEPWRQRWALGPAQRA